jgi:hypothetical protein
VSDKAATQYMSHEIDKHIDGAPGTSTPFFGEALSELETRNIEQAAQALAAGEVVVMQLYTLGLLVDGTNEEALHKLFAAKQIPYERALRGERPIVSILPLREHREELIDIEKHHPDLQEVFAAEDHHLLTPDRHALFYRVHVSARPGYLQVPLIAEDQQRGERSMVLLWHDNPYVRLLEAKARKYKGGELLLTGSSANPTGQPQPSRVEDLHTSILPLITTIVDLRDERILSIPEHMRGAIPIINLIDHPPTVMRGSKMYDALPGHPTIQHLMAQPSQPEAA